MAFCGKCGAEINSGNGVCPVCGFDPNNAAQANQQNTYQQNNQQNNQQANNGAGYDFKMSDCTSEFDMQDIENNKGISLFAYLGILFFIPLVAAPQSRYARFHANQGLVLLLAAIAFTIANAILSAIFAFISFIILMLYNLVAGAVGIVFLVFVIMGIVNAVQGKAKKLPLIGNFTILK